MIDQQIEIPIKDRHIAAFITHSERGGPHPVILFNYPGTHHGFAFPKRSVHHRDAAERQGRLVSPFRRNLWS